MAQDSNDANPAEAKKDFWTQVLSWPVLGAFAAILLSFVGCFMTSAHPYLADSFCIVGIAILLVKLWTWEGLQHSTPRKTALVLTGGTLLLLAFCVGLCLLSTYLGKTSNNLEDNLPHVTNPASPMPPTSGNTQSGVGNAQITTGTGGQTQIMKDSPGGMQAGRDLNIANFGAKQPPPKLIDLPSEQIPAGDEQIFPLSLNQRRHVNPGIKLSFRVEREFPNALFLVECSSPCEGSEITLVKDGIASYAGSDPFSQQSPNKILVNSGYTSSITPDIEVQITVRSKTASQLQSATVKGFVQ